ncbi:PAS domain-containing protein [Chryseobacterium sp. 2TAF14]|uniref:PAS domain-containing protein n=1 Tax=Chryseobacterium sp. 2TAF14 TaxID=3233007 RepID=UPI003F935281
MNAPDQIKAEKLLSVLFYSPNATAIYTGIDIKIISANEAMLNFWGKDKSAIGKTMAEAIPELRDQPFIDILKNVWISGKTYTAKNRAAMLKVNNVLQTFYFDFEYKAILDEKGNTEYILHTAFDVTERRKAENLVQEKSRSEQKLIDVKSVSKHWLKNLPLQWLL